MAPIREQTSKKSLRELDGIWQTPVILVDALALLHAAANRMTRKADRSFLCQ